MPHPRIDGANRRRQTGAALGENQLQGLAFQSAPVQISEQRLPDPSKLDREALQALLRAEHQERIATHQQFCGGRLRSSI